MVGGRRAAVCYIGQLSPANENKLLIIINNHHAGDDSARGAWRNKRVARVVEAAL